MAKQFASAVEAFGYLLDVYEKQPERKTAIRTEPDYAAMDADGEALFHDAATGAEEAGAITVEMRKSPDEHLIKFLKLKDPAALYRWLKRTPRRQLAEAAWAQATASLPSTPDWLERESIAAIEAWSRHQAWRGFPMESHEAAGQALKLAIAIAGGVSPGTTYRQFSAEHAQDSKALKRLEMAVSAILREAMDMPPPADGEPPLAAFGIQAYPDPVFLRGPFVAGPDGACDLGALRVYAALTASNADTIAWKGRAPYLLTIENKDSFNAYVHAVTDAGAVIFIGGSPSSAVVEVLRRLAEGAPETPWYHWGDIDGGGLRIFRFIEETICRPAGIRLRPHLMDPALAERAGQPVRSSLLGVKEIANSDSAVAPIACWLLSPDGRTLEQEMLQPVSPLGSFDTNQTLLQSSDGRQETQQECSP